MNVDFLNILVKVFLVSLGTSAIPMMYAGLYPALYYILAFNCGAWIFAYLVAKA